MFVFLFLFLFKTRCKLDKPIDSSINREDGKKKTFFYKKFGFFFMNVFFDKILRIEPVDTEVHLYQGQDTTVVMIFFYRYSDLLFFKFFSNVSLYL